MTGLSFYIIAREARVYPIVKYGSAFARVSSSSMEAPFTQQDVWQLVLANQRLLRKEIFKFLPRERDFDKDAMFSDVVLARAHAIMRNYDSSKGASPATYLVKVCRWYAFEWVANRKYKKQATNGADDIAYHEGARCTNGEAEAREHAEELLGSLPEELRWVLRCHFIRGNTVGEISDHSGFSKQTIREMINAGLFLARMEGDSDQ